MESEKQYKVIVRQVAYPNGQVLKEFSAYFSTLDQAQGYQRYHTWDSPVSSSVAWIYQLKYDWCPIDN